MKELKLQVEILAQEELKRSMVKFPLFNSTHEGYAVIKEELEETADEMAYAEGNIRCVWTHLKKNRQENAIEYIKELKESAINLAAEAIQVSAMASKFLESFKDE